VLSSTVKKAIQPLVGDNTNKGGKHQQAEIVAKKKASQ